MSIAGIDVVHPEFEASVLSRTNMHNITASLYIFFTHQTKHRSEDGVRNMKIITLLRNAELASRQR